MIEARSLSLSFVNKEVFNDISFTIQETDRIGLVGRNGSGKTTLLKAIIDPSVLDGGSVSIPKRKKIAYMPQEVVLQSSLSILDEALTAFADIANIEKEIARIETLLETSHDDDLLERYSQLHEKLLSYDSDTAKAQTKKILMGLGFSLEQFDQPVANLSVGWKMRIVLAKLLLQEADFYLFDEPTNHLDLIAKEWFLDFLKKSSFGFMLICHERYFLDELCNKIFELELGSGTFYTGGYSRYIIQKEENLERLQSAYTQQQKEIKRKEAVIARFKAGQRAKMAQSMEKQLEKVERIEIPQGPKSIQFSFPPINQSGKEVLMVKKVAQKFNDKVIFQNVTFEVKRGQKVAIIAPNGVGKTTLFNLIARKLPLQQGTITFGHNVTCAIFDQDQNKVLDANVSILDNLKHLCPQTTEQTIRSFLGMFLFTGQDVFKKVSVLSGGEKNRVGMVSVLLQKVNLLLLDEPTNHLDIPSKEVLLEALKEFPGTILFVSHDRDFINDLATHIIELTAQGAHSYEGNYDSYLDQKKK